MKRTMLAVAALVAGVAVGCGGTKEARRDVAAVTPGVEDRREGVVSQIDAESISVTSADNPRDPPVRFVIGEDTRIRRGDAAVDASALEEGEAVRVSFESRAGDERAKAVEILEGDEAAQVRARTAIPPPAWPRPERPAGATPSSPQEPYEAD